MCRLFSRYQSTGTSKWCGLMWGLYLQRYMLVLRDLRPICGAASSSRRPRRAVSSDRRFLAEGWWWLMWFPIPNDVCFWNRKNYTNSRLIIPSWCDIFCRIVPPYHWYSCGGCFNKLGLIPRGWPSGLYENGVDTKMTNLMGKDFCNAILLWDLWGSLGFQCFGPSHSAPSIDLSRSAREEWHLRQAFAYWAISLWGGYPVTPV